MGAIIAFHAYIIIGGGTMDLAKISPFQLIIIATLLSLLISEGKDSDELNAYGNLIVAIGGLVLAVAAQQDLIDSRNKKGEDG